MLNILYKNGDFRSYEEKQYTDYRYFGSVFVVIKDSCWIGIYSMDEIRAIEVEEIR